MANRMLASIPVTQGRCKSTPNPVNARITTHPGEILKAEYLEPLGMSSRALAEALGVPQNRVSDIIRGHRSVTADVALRLARFFRTDPRFWLNLQTAHDLSKAAAETDYSALPQQA